MAKIIKIGLAAAAIIFAAAYAYLQDKKAENTVLPIKNNNTIMNLTGVFANNGSLPAKYTCDGEKINPALSIGGVPKQAKSLVLIVDDPDAPSGTFTHWTVWNIDPSVKSIKENSVPGGAVQGAATADGTGYVPPCPPSGIHRYRFKLYALDSMLDLLAGASISELSTAMNGHVIVQTELVGSYQRQK